MFGRLNRIAQFEKVSWKQFQKDYVDTFGSNTTINMEDLKDTYNKIKLPTRATAGSAGYDFKSPITFTLEPGESIKVPTGIRAKIDDCWVLMIYPRSGLGFKYRLQIDNTVGVIDSDYSFSDNEGHIFCKITNDSKEHKTVTINSGDGFAQGVFMPFGTTYDDNVTKVRNGGFGSTGK